jgi:hypothetical protein
VLGLRPIAFSALRAGLLALDAGYPLALVLEAWCLVDGPWREHLAAAARFLDRELRIVEGRVPPLP